MKDCTPIHNCLACGSNQLVPTLDLKNQPLANNFRSTDNMSAEVSYPLAINRCDNCNHLQLTHIVDPNLIYTHYLYVSSTSRTYVEYMDWYARFVLEYFDTYPNTVLDIGCNDGGQLNSFKNLLLATYGVDPAENLFPLSSKNHNVRCGFWDELTAGSFNDIKFDIITSQNAFSHIPDPLAYLKLVKRNLDDNGHMFISTSQADMVVNGEFDTIYHEHISFYNTSSMKALAERAGLFLQDVVKTPIHGTSYIFVLGKEDINPAHVENIIAMENAAGLQSAETYTNWATGVYNLLDLLNQQIEVYRENGYSIVGYGAAAKGMTLLNASGVRLDAVVDDNPLKQGTWCPGNNAPVFGPDYIENLPHSSRVVFIPLAWNFYKEIVERIRKIRTNEEDFFLRYFPYIKAQTYDRPV